MKLNLSKCRQNASVLPRHFDKYLKMMMKTWMIPIMGMRVILSLRINNLGFKGLTLTRYRYFTARHPAERNKMQQQKSRLNYYYPMSALVCIRSGFESRPSRLCSFHCRHSESTEYTVLHTLACDLVVCRIRPTKTYPVSGLRMRRLNPARQHF